MDKAPKISHWAGIVALLYQNKILKILMVRSRDGTWGIPGGCSNTDESPETTGTRETGEETKLFLSIDSLRPFQEFFFKTIPVYVFYTFIDEYKGRQIKDDDDIVESRLFTIIEARMLHLKHKDKIIIDQLAGIVTPSTIEKLHKEFLINA